LRTLKERTIKRWLSRLDADHLTAVRLLESHEDLGIGWSITIPSIVEKTHAMALDYEWFCLTAEKIDRRLFPPGFPITPDNIKWVRRFAENYHQKSRNGRKRAAQPAPGV
jgi:hypothetical protein